MPVKELLDRFFAHWGNGTWQAESEAAGPHEAGLLRLDCSKARTVLGWRMALELDETVALTAEWYRRATAGQISTGQAPLDLRQLTLEQIDRYEQSAGIRPPKLSSLEPRRQQRLAA